MLESLAFLIFVICILYVVVWSVKAEKGAENQGKKFSLKKPGQPDPNTHENDKANR